MNGTIKVVVTPCGKHFIHLPADGPEFPEIILTPKQHAVLGELCKRMVMLQVILAMRGKERFPAGEYVLDSDGSLQCPESIHEGGEL